MAKIRDPFRSCITGLLLSGGLTLFFYYAILITYTYLFLSVTILGSLIVLCSLLLWISVKYDQASDVIDVFSKTISLDMARSRPDALRYMKFIRPVQPYAAVIGALSGTIFLLVAVPALILYWAVHPALPETALNVCVYVMSAGISIFYYLSNRDQFTSPADRILYFSGILLGPAGIIGAIS
jgi:hypothetical protein